MKKAILLIIFMTTVSQAEPSISIQKQALRGSDCSAVFVKHSLDHITKAKGLEVSYYDSNGSGVALSDLDNDGDIDIVLAQLKGKNSIFWNEGNLSFKKESLSHGNSRAVAVVDVNADGLLDIIFTQSTSGLAYWQNSPKGFTFSSLKGVKYPAYAMLWFDADNDSDLDLITASYDSLLEKDLKDAFLFSEGAGVVYYEQENGEFEATRLVKKSQSLAVGRIDFNNDGKQDIIVGNDFEMPDFIFLNTPDGWLESSVLNTTTRNTMSFSTADIDNDSQFELFASDMKPNFLSASDLAQWMPLMQKSYERKTAFASQLEENFLYKNSGAGFKNQANNLGISATGWSWSGQFGDLNNDGLTDLYVVNGMIATEVFSHLTNNELVEENKAFINTPQGFKQTDAWQLNATESGRGMSMADLDNDGDLDIVINNLESPSVIYENQLCEGNALEVDLQWNSLNSKALGATLELKTSNLSLTRELSSSSGYLSALPSRVHFGFPKDERIKSLKIIWPDGRQSLHEDLDVNSLIVLSRVDP